VPTPESAAAFDKLVAARVRLNEITKQLNEAHAQMRTSMYARQRHSNLQQEWQQAFGEFEAATDDSRLSSIGFIRRNDGFFFMRCEERDSLRRKYKLYIKAYSEAVAQLSGLADSATKSDWDLAWALASRAKHLCDEVHAELLKHREAHYC